MERIKEKIIKTKNIKRKKTKSTKKIKNIIKTQKNYFLK
jgi:hypothetical protein